MKKVKQVFPSRNYITIDTQGDIEIVFNPVGDGTEGDDKLTFRRGRWAFRCNDFLAGKMLPNGENESMNRKIYSLNVVYDSENGEPIIDTTYVDPTSVIPLDGSLVTVGNLGTLATITKQNEIKAAIESIDFSELPSALIQDAINMKIEDIGIKLLSISNYYESSGVYSIINETEFEGNFPPLTRFKCNIELKYNSGLLVVKLIGADCSIYKNGQNIEFRVLNCDKVTHTSGNNTTLYEGIFTKKDFLIFEKKPSGNKTRCDLYGKDVTTGETKNIFTMEINPFALKLIL